MEAYLRVGVISSTHGLKGEVKIFPTTDDPGRFKDLEHVLLDTGKEKRELTITQVKYFKNQVILRNLTILMRSRNTEAAISM